MIQQIPKIRIGNTIHVGLAVMAGGQPRDLTGLTLTVVLVDNRGSKARINGWTIEGEHNNVIRFTLQGFTQNNCGIYKVIVYENANKPNQAVVDSRLFELVRESAMEEGVDSGLIDKDVDLQIGGILIGGRDGTGIADIEQVQSSSASLGENVWKMTLTDGREFSFTVLNGEKGAKGDKGDRGLTGESGPAGNTPRIGQNGNWWIGGTDTGVKADYSGTEAQRQATFEANEAERDETFEAKEATRDAANEAALNCAEELAVLGPEIGKIQKVWRTDGENETFTISDGEGNVVAVVDANGLQVIAAKIKNGEGVMTDLKTWLESLDIDIVNDYSGGVDKALSAEQGKKLKGEIDRLPKDNAQNPNALDFSDEDGNVIGTFTEDGHVKTKRFDSSIFANIQDGDEFAISDPNGNVIFYANKNGVNFVGKNSGGSSQTSAKDDGNTRTDIIYNILYGQSLSYHGNIASGENMHTLLQFLTPDNDYMLLGCTTSVLDDPDALDAFFQGLQPSRTGISGTGIAHANKMYMELLRDENGIDIDWESRDNNVPKYYFQLLGCNPGEVANWDTLANPQGQDYRRLLESVRYAKKFAELQGKTFSVGAVCYMQGEASSDMRDELKKQYDKLWVLASNLNHDIKAITGQNEDIFFVPYQLASFAAQSASIGVPLAQLQLAMDSGTAPDGYELNTTAASRLESGVTLIDRKQILMGAIMNSLDPASANDHIHASQHSYLAAGAQWGVQLKRAIYDGNPIKPIHVLSHNVSERTDGKFLVSLQFHVPVKPLVIDTANGECQSQRATSANYGFSILNGSDTEIVESVGIRRGQEIVIVTTEDPTGLTLTYAVDGWEVGGNLRDSQDIDYSMGSFTYKVHNWCPTFTLTI